MSLSAQWLERLSSFVSAYFADFAPHAVLTGVLLFILATLFGDLGHRFGLPHLFWNERPFAQGVAGASAAILVGYVFLAGYTVDAQSIDATWTARFEEPCRPLAFVAGGVVWSAVLVLGAHAFASLLRALARPVAPGHVDPSPAQLHTLRRARLSRASRRGPMVAGSVAGLAVLGAFVCLLPAIAHPGDTARILYGATATLVVVVYGARARVNPAAAMCLLLGCVVTADVAASELDRVGVPAYLVIAVLGLLVFVAGIRPYRLRFPALEGARAARYRAPFPLATYDQRPAHPHLLATTELGPRYRAGAPRPLVLVCASGGGLRAAVWATAVLTEIERSWDDFPYHVRIVAGASGGMLGAAYWVASLEPFEASSPGLRHGATPETLLERVGADGLSEVARALVLRDLPLALLPVVNRRDRGVRLEETWARNMGPAMKRTFAELREGERAGWRPSLVFSPMLVEDGRRLLVSNVDLDAVTRNHGWVLSAGKRSPLSRSALELSRMFPTELDAMPVAAAARMSATFPYVTPAAALPTAPRRRVVHAGYYDDHGVNVVCGWLDEVLSGPDRGSLAQKVSCVLVVQIRDGASDLAAPHAAAGSPRDTGSLARGLDGLTAPFSAGLVAREAVAAFRNDEQLEALSDRLNAEHGDGFFQTATFTYAGDASLRWSLTSRERRDLATEAARAVDAVRAKLVPIARHAPAIVRRASVGRYREPRPHAE